MYKIGVVGDKDTVLAFKALGIDIYPIFEADEAKGVIDRLAREQYAMIFVTEQVAETLKETIERYRRQLLPAVILIPSSQGSLHIGLNKIKDNMERAVGVNILEEGR